MLVYTIGKRYPFPPPQPGAEGAVAQLTDSFLTIVCYVTRPTPAEIAQWRAGELRYGLYEPTPGLPFILTDAGEGWLFEVTLNLRRPARADAPLTGRDWPELTGRQLTYALVDAQTNVLHGLRIIQAHEAFVAAVRACARRQLSYFSHDAAVDTALERAGYQPLAWMSSQAEFYRTNS